MTMILPFIVLLAGISAGYLLGHWFPAKPIADFKPVSATVVDYECRVCEKKWTWRYIDGVHSKDDIERDYALVKTHTNECLNRAAEEA